MVYILYNPIAKNGNGKQCADVLSLRYPEAELADITALDIRAFLAKCTADDTVYVSGGDGTLNRLANDADGLFDACPIYLYKGGSGNDFLHDVEDAVTDDTVRINDYLKDLPTVTVNGVTRRYINGIGYGIDGMVCEVADKLRAEGKKDISYTMLSIKLLLHGYVPPTATVTVDGESYTFGKVWLASSMKGRYYGGGMKVAPDQDRRGDLLSLVMFHGMGRLRTLMIFPKIFKGEHIRYEKAVKILSGREITVSFDRPTALQIDGETVLGVTTYTVKAAERIPATV